MKKQTARNSVTVEELVERLAEYPADARVSVFNSGGDYDAPIITVVVKKGSVDRITISAQGDE